MSLAPSTHLEIELIRQVATRLLAGKASDSHLMGLKVLVLLTKVIKYSSFCLHDALQIDPSQASSFQSSIIDMLDSSDDIIRQQVFESPLFTFQV
jgi:hypothetical protein